MPLYLLYIEDSRYSAPQLDSLEAMDDGQAVVVTRARLATSAHYTSAEVWEADRFVATVHRSAAQAAITSR